jgi:hypothetical protein
VASRRSKRRRSAAPGRAARTGHLVSGSRDGAYAATVLTKVRHAAGERLGRPRRWRTLESARRGGIGAEVGVYRRDFTKDLLRAIKPRKLLLIDVWWTLGEAYTLNRRGHPQYQRSLRACSPSRRRAVPIPR